MSDPKVIDLIQAARRVILENGWAKGRMYTKEGNCCTMGALYAATNVVNTTGDFSLFATSEEIREASEAVIKAIRLIQEYLGVTSVPMWNDTRDSEQEVLDKLEEVAIWAKEH